MQHNLFTAVCSTPFARSTCSNDSRWGTPRISCGISVDVGGLLSELLHDKESAV